MSLYTTSYTRGMMTPLRMQGAAQQCQITLEAGNWRISQATFSIIATAEDGSCFKNVVSLLAFRFI